MIAWPRQKPQEVGIPREFAPELSQRYWFDRGENAVASHRVAVRRVGRDQLLKEAKHSVERQSVEFQTGVIA